jgi:hypothetical protein
MEAFAVDETGDKKPTPPKPTNGMTTYIGYGHDFDVQEKRAKFAERVANPDIVSDILAKLHDGKADIKAVDISDGLNIKIAAATTDEERKLLEAQRDEIQQTYITNITRVRVDRDLTSLRYPAAGEHQQQNNISQRNGIAMSWVTNDTHELRSSFIPFLFSDSMSVRSRNPEEHLRLLEETRAMPQYAKENETPNRNYDSGITEYVTQFKEQLAARQQHRQ